jgi:hypothetical protein
MKRYPRRCGLAFDGNGIVIVQLENCMPDGSSRIHIPYASAPYTCPKCRGAILDEIQSEDFEGYKCPVCGHEEGLPSFVPQFDESVITPELVEEIRKTAEEHGDFYKFVKTFNKQWKKDFESEFEEISRTHNVYVPSLTTPALNDLKGKLAECKEYNEKVSALGDYIFSECEKILDENLKNPPEVDVSDDYDISRFNEKMDELHGEDFGKNGNPSKDEFFTGEEKEPEPEESPESESKAKPEEPSSPKFLYELIFVANGEVSEASVASFFSERDALEAYRFAGRMIDMTGAKGTAYVHKIQLC